MPRSIRTRFSLSPAPLAAAALLVVSGCTVGPSFQRPSPSMPEGFTGTSLSSGPEGISSISASGAGPELTTWWTTLGDDKLVELIDQTLAGNLDIAQARERIIQARAGRRIAAGAELPTVDAAGSASRSRSPAGGGSTGNAFSAGFDASWEIDVFGGIRRTVEAADETVAAAVEDRRDVQVTLTGEVARLYIDLRNLQRRLAIAKRNLELQLDTVGLTSERFEAGFIGSLDVANAKALAASTQSRIPVIEANIANTIYLISVLLGRQPQELLAELSPEGPVPVPPASVPVGLPSELLQRRPDLRRAERQLAAQNARIGVAVSDLYPRFSLTGSFGLQGDEISALGTLAQRYWSIGPAVRWNVFDGGRIRGNIDLQKSVFQEQLLIYQQSVLNALADVEVALSNFNREQIRRVSLIDAVDNNRLAVDAATELYAAGRSDFLNVINAQARLLDAEDTLSQSESAISTHLVSLYKALGGGWSQEPGDPAEPAAPPISTPTPTVPQTPAQPPVMPPGAQPTGKPERLEP